jgi:hypothetical protein
MKTAVKLALAFLVLTASGCAVCYPTPTPEPVGGSAVEETYATFSGALRGKDNNPDFATVYNCLSEQTRKRYKYWEFRLLFNVKPGMLLRALLTKWNVKCVTYNADRTRATLTIVHGEQPEYTKNFYCVNEKGTWKIDFYLADTFGMPREDEDFLFPPEPSGGTDGAAPPDETQDPAKPDGSPVK